MNDTVGLSKSPETFFDVEFQEPKWIHEAEIKKLELCWGNRTGITFRTNCLISDKIADEVLRVERGLLDAITEAIGPAEATKHFYMIGMALGYGVGPFRG